jgi:CRISPR-associated endonuclease/helicase Cas3
VDARALWAKSDPYHPLWCHLLDVAAVCGALLHRFGPVASIPDRWIMYLAAMHDIGKADPEFQNKDDEQAERLRALGLELPEERTRFRHEARSADWITPHLHHQQWTRDACRIVSMATRAHHGDFRAGLHGEGTFYEENQPHLRQRTALWNELRVQLSEIVREALDLPVYSAPDFTDASAAGILLAGLIVLADWIASNAELYGYETLDRNLPPRDYFAVARQRANRIVHALEFDQVGSPPEGYSAPAFSKVWPQITCPRPFQTVLETVCREGLSPGLAILEAPMGEGKTEAAIYLALHWNRLLGRKGLYIALPTMATSNQMHSRYKDFLHKQSGGTAPRLIHGMSWLFAEDQPEGEFETAGDAEEARRAKDWFGNVKRAILAPEGVGTVDQVLMTALNVKHGFLRFLGLSARTLIIDEVHAYDVYMTTLIRRLLTWCRTLRIPVILLSATLSRAQKQSMIEAYSGEVSQERADPICDPYPLLTFVPWGALTFYREARATQMRDVQIHRYYGMLPGRRRDAQQEVYRRTAELALNLSKRGGCLCVLMNTVAAAQEVYKALGDFPHKLLFHARFPAVSRNKIETKVLRLFGKGKDGRPENPRRPKRYILVCTQVVEQSLDVDFDAMITQLAPVDLLLQRSGRVWRHERGVRPTGDHPALHILLPEHGAFSGARASGSAFGATGRVYDHHNVLLHTLAELEKRDTFHLPDDFRPLIESCYGNDVCPSGISETIYREAVENSHRKDGEDENAARTHLIAEPSERDFTLGRMRQDGVEEGEEGEAASYFRARTRLGDDTRNALFVEEARLQQAIRRGVAAKQANDRKQAFPGNALMRSLFLQKASIPVWWLQELEPSDGYAWVTAEDGPDWTRRHTVFFLQNGEWRGRKDETEVVLRNDPALGLTLETVRSGVALTTTEEEEQQKMEEVHNDADVGSAT